MNHGKFISIDNLLFIIDHNQVNLFNLIYKNVSDHTKKINFIQKIIYNNSPILNASMNNDKTKMLELLNNNADITHVNYYGCNFIDVPEIHTQSIKLHQNGMVTCTFNTSLERIFTILQDNKITANLKQKICNQKNSNGNTALHFAVYAGDLESIPLLLKAGNNCNIKNQQGKTPLIILLQQQNGNKIEELIQIINQIIIDPDLIRQVIQHKTNRIIPDIEDKIINMLSINLSFQDNSGNTLLHHLVHYLNKVTDDKQQQSIKLMDILLKDQPNLAKALEIRNHQGDTAFDVAHQQYIKEHWKSKEEYNEDLISKIQDAEVTELYSAIENKTLNM